MSVARTPRARRTGSHDRARFSAGLFDEIVVDLFAGGGGASLGIERALGRSVDVAVNHDPIAVAMHRINHPHTRHYKADVFEVDPLDATGGRPVGLLWASPDCTQFSRAKGGKPIRDSKKKLRCLAWVVVKWAKRVQPRVILMENVREFADWGPLGKDDRPCPKRKGTTFRRWLNQLRALGYAVEWRVLNAADYGAPTHRRRLCLIARRDGEPIVWPETTHGPGRSRAYRTAAECIDWSLPCHSIFLTRQEGRAMGVNRPLAAKTMRRIAMGVKRFVLENPKPFIVRVNHGVDHFRGQSVDAPLGTVTSRHGYGVAAPFVIQQNGEAPHQDTRGQKVDEPIRTVTPRGGGGFSLVQYNGQKGNEVRGSAADQPVNTVTPEPRFALAAANLIRMGRNAVQWSAADKPLGTVCAGGNHHAVTTATLDGGKRVSEVRAFLLKYYGTGDGQAVDEPIHTIPSVDRFGVVTVGHHDYVIGDIGLRMLSPRELFRCQGFPDGYCIDFAVPAAWLEESRRRKGRAKATARPSDPNRMKPLPKDMQTLMVGNSVPPDLSEALTRANFADLAAPARRSTGRRIMEARA
jgi:DNA (cytosine-5)-methyltransferase 1